MGQYHILCNLTKKQFVHPGGLGFGNKQREHLGFADDFGDVLYLLTMIPKSRGGGDILPDGNWIFIGGWLGDRVAVVGDYSLDSDLPDYPEFGSIYSLCSENTWSLWDGRGYSTKFDKDNPWRDITGDLAQELEIAFDKKIIGIDHPTLWPDGTRKPDHMIECFKKARSILRRSTK